MNGLWDKLLGQNGLVQDGPSGANGLEQDNPKGENGYLQGRLWHYLSMFMFKSNDRYKCVEAALPKYDDRSEAVLPT